MSLWSHDFWNNSTVTYKKQNKEKQHSSFLSYCYVASCHATKEWKWDRQYRWQNYFSLYFWEENTAERLIIIGRMSDLLKSLLSTQDSLLPVCYIFCTVEVWKKLVRPIIAKVWYIQTVETSLDQSWVGGKFSCLRPSLIRSGMRDHKWKVVALY